MMETDYVRAEKYYKKAIRLQMEGKVDEAIEYYKISIDILPSAQAHCYLGWAYSYKGLLNEAIAECQIAIRLDPEFGNPYNDIGAYLIGLNREEEAIAYLKTAMTKKGYATPYYSYYNLGRILERRGEWFEALEEYRASLKIEPKYQMAKDAYYRLMALMQ